MAQDPVPTAGPGRWHVLVMAKAPRAGRVKTRLCPPLGPIEAADVAAAALADTLAAVAASGAERRIVALDGAPGDWLPPGFEVIPQVGGTFDARLAAAWAAAGGPGLQIGMDTPQVTPDLLDRCLATTEDGGASIGAAADGGWWAIGFAGPCPARAFDGIAMSTPWTGAAQRARLVELGYLVAELPALRDVDVAADADEVAAAVPDSRFAAAWRAARARSAS